jgi:hypothetical protein
MKRNIQKVRYGKNDKCTWYSYKEICDECGDVIQEFGDFMTTVIPSESDKDFCLKCMRINLNK